MSARTLGPGAALAFVVGTMVGTGILLAPPRVAAAVPTLGAGLGLWVGVGLLCAAGALVYAELGARRPDGGGEVHFLAAAFGPRVGAGAGHAVALLAFAGSAAALAEAVPRWQLPVLLGAAQGTPPVDLAAPLLGLPGTRWAGLVLLGAVALAARAPARGWARAVQVLAWLPAAGLLGLAGLAFARAGAPAAGPGGAVSVGGLAGAFQAVWFAFAGWPAATWIAGELRDPARTLPRALLGGTLAVTALYALVYAALVAGLGWDGLPGAGEAGTALATRLLGPAGAVGMAALVALALLGTLLGTVVGGARVLAAARGWPTAPPPGRALGGVTAVAAGFLLSGGFDLGLRISTLAMLAVAALAAAALPVLRRRAGPAPFVAPAGTGLAVAFGLAVGLAAVVGLALAPAADRWWGLAGLGLAVGAGFGRGTHGASGPFRIEPKTLD
jgi:APA family basic amino acid/polyamine antiporter